MSVSSRLRVLAAGLFLVLGVAPVQAATPSPCIALCASWQLDSAASGDPVQAIKTAVFAYKEEKLRRPRRSAPNDLAGMANDELEESFGPLRERPRRDELAKELTRELDIPQQLRISVKGDEVLIDEGRGSPRRFRPGEPHSRVDAMGTAQIIAEWNRTTFVVREKYNRKQSNRENYSVDTRSGTLTVTRTIERPAMPDIILRSLYRPAPPPAPKSP